MSEITCSRCNQKKEALIQAPYPGRLGKLILKSCCQTCMDEWKKFSVMVINDFKLRPFLPKDREVLETHLREFLKLVE